MQCPRQSPSQQTHINRPQYAYIQLGRNRIGDEGCCSRMHQHRSLYIPLLWEGRQTGKGSGRTYKPYFSVFVVQ